ncbi:MAG: GAF domain-containing protein [Pirellulaceae bacterium]|nr:GAF domain-containing protein [Pirellulaceae bacterium]
MPEQDGSSTGAAETKPAADDSSRLVRCVLDAIPEPTIAIGLDWRVLFANRAARTWSGVDPDSQFVCCYTLSHGRNRPCEEYGESCPLRDVIAAKAPACVAHTHFDAQGREVHVEVTAAPIFNAFGEVVQVVASWRDVSEPKGVRRLLEIANRHTNMAAMLEEFVDALRKLTGCGAIAIRVLDEHGGIAYHAQLGFSREFCDSEGSLSIHGHHCLCMKVITGEVGDLSECRTEGGSVCVGSTSRFLNSLSSRQRSQYRNVCNEFGFESLALIPIRDAGRILGLIQLADCRPDAVSNTTVETLERLALHLGTAIQRVRAEEALHAANERLEDKVQRRTAELARTNQALEQEIAERNRLEKQILEISSAEQQRIGQELHDGLGQELTGLNCLATLLRKRLEAAHSPEASAAAELARGIPRTLKQVERIVQGLMPLEIGADDLVPAIELLLSRMQEGTGVECRFRRAGSVRVEDDHSAVQIYRIAQEAVTNAVKHGGPRRVLVSLTERDADVLLEVRDDGLGIRDDVGSASGFGLRIMAYRARAVGGCLEINPGPEGGTVVTCSVPKERDHA